MNVGGPPPPPPPKNLQVKETEDCTLTVRLERNSQQEESRCNIQAATAAAGAGMGAAAAAATAAALETKGSVTPLVSGKLTLHASIFDPWNGRFTAREPTKRHRWLDTNCVDCGVHEQTQTLVCGGVKQPDATIVKNRHDAAEQSAMTALSEMLDLSEKRLVELTQTFNAKLAEEKAKCLQVYVKRYTEKEQAREKIRQQAQADMVEKLQDGEYLSNYINQLQASIVRPIGRNIWFCSDSAGLRLSQEEGLYYDVNLPDCVCREHDWCDCNGREFDLVLFSENDFCERVLPHLTLPPYVSIGFNHEAPHSTNGNNGSNGSNAVKNMQIYLREPARLKDTINRIRILQDAHARLVSTLKNVRLTNAVTNAAGPIVTAPIPVALPAASTSGVMH